MTALTEEDVATAYLRGYAEGKAGREPGAQQAEAGEEELATLIDGISAFQRNRRETPRVIARALLDRYEVRKRK